MNYLVSYPRSGNTWVRFILEWFSGRPSNGSSIKDRPLHRTIKSKSKFGELIKKELEHVKGSTIIQKAHTISEVIYKKGKLILLIRNPMEAILRHRAELQNEEYVKHFMSLIELYDEWPNENKIIVYYEDLLEHPQKNIESIVRFMELDLNKLTDFMNSYDELFNLSINFYDTKTDGNASKTKGKKLIHHSLNLSEEEIINFKTYLNNTYPKLTTYLRKYDI